MNSSSTQICPYAIQFQRRHYSWWAKPTGGSQDNLEFKFYQYTHGHLTRLLSFSYYKPVSLGEENNVSITEGWHTYAMAILLVPPLVLAWGWNKSWEVHNEVSMVLTSTWKILANCKTLRRGTFCLGPVPCKSSLLVFQDLNFYVYSWSFNHF